MNICEIKKNRLEFKLVVYPGEIIIIREEKKSLVNLLLFHCIVKLK